jgi:hypothetical protein
MRYRAVASFGVLALAVVALSSCIFGGQAQIRLLSLDVYLTNTSATLDDASPVFSGVASGAAAGDATIDSGSYRLRVTAAGDKTDLRLDVASVTFDSKKVSSLILTSTHGGVLVNAMYLVQQGALGKYENTKARVRGAVAIANGTAVTLNVGQAGLLTSAAVGTLGNYGLVDSGSASVSLAVDGAAVSALNQTLAAGGDYTLLVWSNAGGYQATLISDDNHVPASSGKVKIRLLNGLSGLAAPATLAVNFSPLAEAIAVGQASSPSEIDGGTGYELDVANSNTGANLLSKTLVTLTATDVFTMLVTGGSSTAVTGTLRKDR